MCSILTVEDDPDVCAVLTTVLEGNGHEVYTASDGLEALAWLRATPQLPCLIIVDLRMPQLNGWDFLDRLQLSPSWIEIPVIVASALIKRNEPDPLLRAKEFWSKPLDFGRVERVHEHCRVHGAPGDGRAGDPTGGVVSQSGKPQGR